MTYVRQRFRSDCGIACAAMLTGLSYDRVMRVFQRDHSPGESGKADHDLMIAMARLNPPPQSWFEEDFTELAGPKAEPAWSETMGFEDVGE